MWYEIDAHIASAGHSYTCRYFWRMSMSQGFVRVKVAVPFRVMRARRRRASRARAACYATDEKTVNIGLGQA